MNVVAFGKEAADFVEANVHKGSQISFEGQLAHNEWTKGRPEVRVVGDRAAAGQEQARPAGEAEGGKQRRGRLLKLWRG